MASSTVKSAHVLQFVENLNEVAQILDIHEKVSGSGPGRRYDIEALNKSAIVLLVACWEAFVEDLAEAALKQLIHDSNTHTVFPELVLERVGSKNSGKNAWNLAGDGWKRALQGNLSEVLAKTTGALNTPKTAQVDELFQKALGVERLSNAWAWRGRSVAQARLRLDELITLRGAIAHRVKHSASVQKKDVTAAADLVGRLGEASHNFMREFLHERTGKHSWHAVKYRGRT